MTTSGNFRRPKVWSSTRMVVYEWDMIVILGKCSVLQPSIKVSFASTSPWIGDVFS